MTPNDLNGAAAVSDELLPCPFCGTSADLVKVARDWWVIAAEHDESCALDSDFSLMAPQTGEGRAWVLSAWNRRCAIRSIIGAAPVAPAAPAKPADATPTHDQLAALDWAVREAAKDWRGIHWKDLMTLRRALISADQPDKQLDEKNG